MMQENTASSDFRKGLHASAGAAGHISITAGKAVRTVIRLSGRPMLLLASASAGLLLIFVLVLASYVSSLLFTEDPRSVYRLERDAISAWIADDYAEACAVAGGCSFSCDQAADRIYFELLCRDTLLTRMKETWNIPAAEYTDASVGDPEAFAAWIAANSSSFFRVSGNSIAVSVTGYRSRDQSAAVKYLSMGEDLSLWNAFKEFRTQLDYTEEINREVLSMYGIEVELPEASAGSALAGFTGGGLEKPLFEGQTVNLIDCANWAGSGATGTKSEAYAYWESVIYPDMEAAGLITYGGYQCTDFAHWRFWKYYGFDCGGGNGDQMAANTVKRCEGFRLFTADTALDLGFVKAGSVFSSTVTNHVGFIEAVDIESMTITFSDGNYHFGGLRFNNTVTFDEFFAHWGGQFAVPED